jgi:hypothetical protein
VTAAVTQTPTPVAAGEVPARQTTRGRQLTPCLCLCLILLVVVAFAHRVQWRAPWFDRLGTGERNGLTASTALFSTNRHREGPWHPRGLTRQNPKSPPFSTPAGRQPQVSCPPGTEVAVYLAALTSGSEPAPVMGSNLGKEPCRAPQITDSSITCGLWPGQVADRRRRCGTDSEEVFIRGRAHQARTPTVNGPNLGI